MDTKMANKIRTGVLSECMTTTHILVPDFLYNYGIEYFKKTSGGYWQLFRPYIRGLPNWTRVLRQ